MKKKFSLSLCMIVKNEERCLERCLKSVQKVVDEVIIVDTGSTDQTVQIAKEHGAIIKHYTWENDFAAARNHSLSFATKDWILVLDADEYLREEDYDLLIETLNDTTYDSYFIQTLNFSQPEDKNTCMVNLNHRIFKNNKGFHYTSAIHEQLKIPPSSSYKITDIGFYHTGYLKEVVAEKNKTDRNLNILIKLLEEDPTHSITLFYVANEHYQLGEYKKAIEFFDKSYEYSQPTQGHIPKLTVFRVNAYQANNQLDDALTVAEEQLKKYPRHTYLMYLKGTIEEELDQELKAIQSYKACIKLGKPTPDFEILVGASGPWPHLKLARLLKKHKEFNEAIQHYNHYLTFEPTQVTVLYEIVECLKGLKFPASLIIQYLERYLPHQNQKTLLVKVNILIHHQLFLEATPYLDQLMLTEPQAGIIALYAKHQFYLKNYEQSQAYFLKCTKKNEDTYVDPSCYLLFMLTKEEQLDPEVTHYPPSILQFHRFLKGEKVALDTGVVLHLLEDCAISDHLDLFSQLSQQVEKVEDLALWQQLISLYLKYDLKEQAKKLLVKVILKEKELSKETLALIKTL